MNHKIILFFLLGIDALILILQTSELSISYYEISALRGETSLLSLLVNSSLSFFGQNDYALRAPMILLHIFSSMLLYLISRPYLPNERNRLWLVFIFILLPGVISSALLVNSAGIIIFALFLFVYIYQNFSIKYIYLLLSVYVFLNSDFLYLFLALLIYAVYQKDKMFFVFNLFLLSVSIYLYGLGIHGVPKGHFLDTIGLYSAIFTPIIFIYIFYVLYRRVLLKEIDIVWFVATTGLLLSLILSFRQRMMIEDFAPYLMLALPLAAQTFYKSYRVRLHIFRKKYKMIFILSLLFLIFNSLVVFFNKELYIFIDNPKKYFAYKMHIAKELAVELHKRDISCVNTDKRMSLRLAFYGIHKCEKFTLDKVSFNSKVEDIVTISYENVTVYKASVTKVNK